MSKKKDDLDKHIDKYLKNPSFAKAFKEERDNLRIAVRVAELREKRGLTQKDLAEKVHTTQSVISRLESADYENYSIHTLKKIAVALNVRLIVDFQY